jgi:hypothetical protein
MQTVFAAQTDMSEALPSGAVTPVPRRSPSPSRRETILSLVEMLLQKEGDDEGSKYYVSHLLSTS